MITDVVTGDVFRTNLKHIAFAINAEGFNDAGFAGMVTSQFVPALENTGPKVLGTVLSTTTRGKTFHGLVCHKLEIDGWKKTPEVIKICLDKIEAPETEPIAIVLMGAGMIGQMSGADVKANIKAIHLSKKNCIVYTLEYTKDAIMNVLSEN